MSKRFLQICCVVFLSLVCSSQSFAAKKITVLLDWFVNPDHAPLFVAQEKGYFKDQGLEVEFIAPDMSPPSACH